MKICIAQFNTIVGDLEGNTALIKNTIDHAKQRKADCLVFPESVLTGYPPKDLLCHEGFYDQIKEKVKEIQTYSKAAENCLIILGTPWKQGDNIYNAALIIQDGEIAHIQEKCQLPNTDVFDEKRYFTAGDSAAIIEWNEQAIAVCICEDIWHEQPLASINEHNPDLIINISASPFEIEKHQQRLVQLKRHAKDLGAQCLFVNQVGANDELIFDGRSCLMSKDGELSWEAPAFEHGLFEVNLGDTYPIPKPKKTELIYKALITGIRDYVQKSGFDKVLIALSGGIDSALTAVLAVAALGEDKVTGIAMPGPYSSEHSLEDAKALAKNLGVSFRVHTISEVYKMYTYVLNREAEAPDLSLQNLQARIRGSIMMTLSNKENALVLSTGNKSEIAMGYCTTYGDMCGALAVISDLYKAEVYELANYINTEKGKLIPQHTIDKAPSAELAPNQKDDDSLPAYPILDAILYAYIEEEHSIQDIANAQDLRVADIETLIQRYHNNEYKRHQMPPGLKLSKKAFGSGRRYPLAKRLNF